MRWFYFSFLSFGILFPFVSLSGEVQEKNMPAQILVENLRGSLAAAGQGEVREMVPVGLALVKMFEKWQPKPVNDAAEYCTIGFGHLLALQPCETLDISEYASGITVELGTELLENDSRLARSAVEQLTERHLDDNQFSAVAAFVFSVGSEKFEGSNMRALINRGDFKGAADEFKKWNSLRGRVLQSMVARRACERKLYISELDGTVDKELNLIDCAD